MIGTRTHKRQTRQGFTDRDELTIKLTNEVVPILESRGYLVGNTGVEHILKKNPRLLGKICGIEGNASIDHLRGMPDHFVARGDHFTYVEFKVCKAPAPHQSIADRCKNLNPGVENITMETIGAIQKSHFEHYLNLHKLMGCQVTLVIKTPMGEIVAEEIQNLLALDYYEGSTKGSGKTLNRVHMDLPKLDVAFPKPNVEESFDKSSKISPFWLMDNKLI